MNRKATTKKTYSKVDQYQPSGDDIPVCVTDVMTLDDNSDPILFEHVGQLDLLQKSWSPVITFAILIVDGMILIAIHPDSIVLFIMVLFMLVMLAPLARWCGPWLIRELQFVSSSNWDGMLPHSTQIHSNNEGMTMMELTHTMRSSGDDSSRDCCIRIPVAKISDVRVEKAAAHEPGHVLTTEVVVALSNGATIDSFIDTGIPPQGFLTCRREIIGAQNSLSSTRVLGAAEARPPANEEETAEYRDRGILRIEGLVNPYRFRNRVLQAIPSAGEIDNPSLHP